jgi:hypothetical protein
MGTKIKFKQNRAIFPNSITGRECYLPIGTLKTKAKRILNTKTLFRITNTNIPFFPPRLGKHEEKDP